MDITTIISHVPEPSHGTAQRVTALLTIAFTRYLRTAPAVDFSAELRLYPDMNVRGIQRW